MVPAGEQGLGAEDVADAGDHRLVKERRSQCAGCRLQAGPSAVGVGVLAQRVGPEAGQQPGHAGVVEQLAGGRCDQVPGGIGAGQPEPHLGQGRARNVGEA
jgi:hypothetical protein